MASSQAEVPSKGTPRQFSLAQTFALVSLAAVGFAFGRYHWALGIAAIMIATVALSLWRSVVSIVKSNRHSAILLVASLCLGASAYLAIPGVVGGIVGSMPGMATRSWRRLIGGVLCGALLDVFRFLGLAVLRLQWNVRYGYDDVLCTWMPMSVSGTNLFYASSAPNGVVLVVTQVVWLCISLLNWYIWWRPRPTESATLSIVIRLSLFNGIAWFLTYQACSFISEMSHGFATLSAPVAVVPWMIIFLLIYPTCFLWATVLLLRSPGGKQTETTQGSLLGEN